MPELNIIERVIALEAVDLLQNLSPDQLARIATIAREMPFPAGATIFTPEHPQDAMYVIIDGSVEITRGGEAVHTARQYEVLGAWALFDTEPLGLAARAAEDTRLLRIGRDDFFDLLSDNAEITASIFSAIVRRFRKLVES